MFTVSGEQNYGSWCGLLLTVIIFAIVTLYSVLKVDVLLNFDDTNYQSYVAPNKLDPDKEYL